MTVCVSQILQEEGAEMEVKAGIMTTEKEQGWVRNVSRDTHSFFTYRNKLEMKQ